MRGIRPVFVFVVAVAPLVLGGCSSSRSGGSGSSVNTTARSGAGTTGAASLSGTITVDAAASLTEAFGALATEFETAHPGTTVTTRFGASSDLATQIGQGAKADVFASASTKTMTALGSEALHSTPFVRNSLEIATPPANPGKVQSVADLAKPGLKIAVCDPAVPCGAVAGKVFANAKITVKPSARLADVKATLAAVESGEVDAGLVYVTDVRSAGSKVHGVPIPDAVDASTAYPIAVLKSAANSSVAQAFVAYVISADGKKVLLADGFKDA